MDASSKVGNGDDGHAETDDLLDGSFQDLADNVSEPDVFEEFEDLTSADDGDELDVLFVGKKELSKEALSHRLSREVLPRLRRAEEHPGYLTLGMLAHAVAALQGSDLHLRVVKDFVRQTAVPVLPSRVSKIPRDLSLEIYEETRRRFADVVRGEPDEQTVITRLGYRNIPLTPNTRIFLMQAWMNHCLSRAEERHHTAIVAAEIVRTGSDHHAWCSAARASREALIVDNLWLVARVARNFAGHGIDIDDLQQTGVTGVCGAIGRYDPTRGFRFSTYAGWWVQQAITRYIADQSRLIRLPAYVHERQRQVQIIATDITKIHGKTPSVDQVAASCGDLPVEAVRGLLESSRPRSLDNENHVKLIRRWLETDDADLVEGAEGHLRFQTIARLLETLTEREAFVLRQRFGLAGCEPRTLEEIGQVLGRTRERIRQIEAKALKRLRHPSRKRVLAQLVDESPEKQPDADAAAILAALPHFKPHDQMLLKHVFGLEGVVQPTLQTVAQSTGAAVWYLSSLRATANRIARDIVQRQQKAASSVSPQSPRVKPVDHSVQREPDHPQSSAETVSVTREERLLSHSVPVPSDPALDKIVPTPESLVDLFDTAIGATDRQSAEAKKVARASDVTPSPDFHSPVLSERAARVVWSIIPELAAWQRYVVGMRLGLEQSPRTAADTAACLNVSLESVRIAEQRLLRALRGSNLQGEVRCFLAADDLQHVELGAETSDVESSRARERTEEGSTPDPVITTAPETEQPFSASDAAQTMSSERDSVSVDALQTDRLTTAVTSGREWADAPLDLSDRTRRLLKNAVNYIDPEFRRILRARFGLYGKKGLSTDQVVRELRTSRAFLRKAEQSLLAQIADDAVRREVQAFIQESVARPAIDRSDPVVETVEEDTFYRPLNSAALVPEQRNERSSVPVLESKRTPDLHQIRSILSHLTAREILVVDALYGLSTGRPLPPRTIAQQLSLSALSVCNVDAKVRGLLSDIASAS